MFIKWRTYQRQLGHIKGDRYLMQPILMRSFRISKQSFMEYAEAAGIPKHEHEPMWKERKDEFKHPRQFTICRLRPFPSCDYVYFDDPNHIENRLRYWEYLEIMLRHSKISGIGEDDKQKIRNEIETILPKPDGSLLDILERAYQAGMPKARPYVNVVSNHVALQNEPQQREV